MDAGEPTPETEQDAANAEHDIKVEDCTNYFQLFTGNLETWDTKQEFTFDSNIDRSTLPWFVVAYPAIRQADLPSTTTSLQNFPALKPKKVELYESPAFN
jgi:hypothetical protein